MQRERQSTKKYEPDGHNAVQLSYWFPVLGGILFKFTRDSLSCLFSLGAEGLLFFPSSSMCSRRKRTGGLQSCCRLQLALDGLTCSPAWWWNGPVDSRFACSWIAAGRYILIRYTVNTAKRIIEPKLCRKSFLNDHHSTCNDPAAFPLANLCHLR